jgi:molybdopterin converting factor small subunit
MVVRVQLFAVAGQLAGCREIELELPDGATVVDLRHSLVQAVPALGPLMGQMLFAVDHQYARDQARIEASSDVACIPPVSGG